MYLRPHDAQSAEVVRKYLAFNRKSMERKAGR
jgi:hypothetical protein